MHARVCVSETSLYRTFQQCVCLCELLLCRPMSSASGDGGSPSHSDLEPLLQLEIRLAVRYVRSPPGLMCCS